MKSEKFGNPDRFGVEISWATDYEPREHRPACGGWSTGKLKLTVGGHVLTLHTFNGEIQDSIHWYLFPIFKWFSDNWISILHEENYSWRENGSGPAAITTFMAMRRLIAMADADSRNSYARVQSWWRRHALRAADSSALYPDIFFRRLGDDIEISWTARQPVHAPDGFRFSLNTGVATLSVHEVAKPIWDALNWLVNAHPAKISDDLDEVKQLQQQLEYLKKVPVYKMESSYLPESLLNLVDEAKKKYKLMTESSLINEIPALSHIDSPVLMFGGVNPEISGVDVEALIKFIAENKNGEESKSLEEYVDSSIGAPVSTPFEEGYDLAEDFIESLNISAGHQFVDIRKVLHGLAIKVTEEELFTDSIRGVAIAGENYSPAILVNTKSSFNKTEVGKRFTLAHELFHVLYDRTRAQCVAHASGSWASPGVEKRANAFAAMLLMPRGLVKDVLNYPISIEGIRAVADALQVGVSALIEHLYNLNFIDESQRSQLRENINHLN